ncbi:MAG TPA: PhaM family polyhydroxyalkanoate granule multifunctional regulatory protein [Ramlibacter sp.]|jgi:hypothetical protein|nr:PhaM family polyhydroxyalkanoate granule multifunctional regulatory protein [Ramlibacter sp.]
MSETNNFGFAKLVPGFDFLQNLAKGTSQGMPQMPHLSKWVAPTLDVEELEKRISELKAVHFWLDQNGKALSATIQALEVQKMTLATLQGMNFKMADLADAMKLKPDTGKEAHKAKDKPAAAKGGSAGTAPVDPLQWWGALTQQFQEIAATAMQDVAQKSAPQAARTAAASDDTDAPAKKGGARKSAPRKKSAPKS